MNPLLVIINLFSEYSFTGFFSRKIIPLYAKYESDNLSKSKSRIKFLQKQLSIKKSIEDLQVQKMIENAPSKVRDSISDVGFRMFRSMLEYKANWYGRRLVVVPSNYPSSQLCWKCHNKNPDVKDLTIRKWTCSHCGCKHDRDKNASRNILTEGLRILRKSA